ncbi:uncharacterized protein LOC124457185 [Xenia sp. Carnegie-2017]|uniref:uncharacterized protein LOC124457185 n=1 Tax=Xenia sp. Carnegie-2017 TaxID=2897299 RepID=UPI001F049FA6|nr:uncharacterized protein LOC124457185 [Xenia sp. Carnegie-2017]
MSSFKTIRNFCLVLFEEGYITEYELIILYKAYKSRNPELPFKNYEPFCLDNLSEDECKVEFRANKHDLIFLQQNLRIPEIVKCPQRTTCSGLEGLCILLNRLAYPCRFSDMIGRFGRPVPELCMIANTIIDFIYNYHKRKITEWNHDLLSPENLQVYANAIHEKGAPYENCFGFIDGTVRPISRPTKHQRIVYNGHKRVHSLKFQGVALPNGLIAHIFGPVEGKKHDAGMLADSNFLQDLEQNAFSVDGRPLCIYGDPAYPQRIHLQAPFRHGVITDRMKEFNKQMSSVRVSVEWLFGDVINSFRFMDFKKNLKIGLSSVGKAYIVCALLRNSLTCMYGNITSKFFQLDPPALENYFITN